MSALTRTPRERSGFPRVATGTGKRTTITAQSHFTMLIQWSDDDQAFLVTLPEWQARVFGPVTHGDTYEEAVRDGREALELLIESAIQHGESLPAPQHYIASTSSYGLSGS